MGSSLRFSLTPSLVSSSHTAPTRRLSPHAHNTMARKFAPSAATLAAAVLAAMILFTAVDSAGAVYLSVKNNLPSPLRIHCFSDHQTQANHDSRPGASFGFDISRNVDSSWTCAFSGDPYGGTFLLWAAHGGPCNNPYTCPWVADDYGLSLTRYDGYVEHVYRWP